MIVKKLQVLAFALSALSAQAALAQTPQDSPPPAASNQLLSGGELDALVAPIALYPDAKLLANMPGCIDLSAGGGGGRSLARPAQKHERRSAQG